MITTTTVEHLRVFEMNYSCSPNGVDTFQVCTEPEKGDEIIGSFYTLGEAVTFCYNRGSNFTIYTLEAWEKEYGNG
jgi:hypothetical protein